MSAKRGLTIDSVLITWTVDEIVYTPETYTLFYGQTKDSLQGLTPVTSGENLMLQNVLYQVTIEELEPGSHYFYKLVSENTHSTTDSQIHEFTAGMCLCNIIL